MADRPLASRVARSLLLSGVGNVVSKGINVVAILVVLKLLTPEAFGVANLVLALFAIVQAVTELGLGAALVQAPSPTRAQIDGLFWLSVLVSAVLYGLLFLSAPLVAAFYGEPELTALVRVFGLVIIVFSLYFVPRNLLLKELAFDRLVIIDNAALLASGVLMIMLAYYGFGAWSIILGELGSRVVMLLAYQSVHPYWPRLQLSLDEVRPLVSFGLYATGARLLYNVYSNADYLIVGRLFGVEAVGLYTLAYRIVADPVKTLASVVNDVAFPAFSKLQDDLGRLRLYLFTIARASLVGIGVLLLTIALYIDWILEVGGYDEWLGAVPLIHVFAGFGLLRCVIPLVPQLLNAVGQARQNFYFNLIGAVLLPLAFIVGGQFGLLGVAWAWSLGYLVVVLPLLWFGARAVAVPPLRFGTTLFRGLGVLVPFAVLALGLRLGLVMADLPLLIKTILGTVVTLGLGGVLLFWRERAVLTLVRGKQEPTV